jgi:hypothetical protein
MEMWMNSNTYKKIATLLKLKDGEILHTFNGVLVVVSRFRPENDAPLYDNEVILVGELP